MKTKLLLKLTNTWVLFLLLFSTHSFAQQVIRCGTVENDEQLRSQYPELQSEQEFETWLAGKIEEKKQLEAVGLIIDGVYQIPVVVHVVHNGEAVGTGTNISYAAIQSQIDVLNEDFRRLAGTNGYNTHPDGADTHIEFCLAKRRPDGSPFPNGEDGVNRINRNTAGFSAPPYSSAYVNATIKPYCTVTQNWSPARYMNFWSVNLSGGLLGYAQFPTTVLGGMGCGTQSANTDGVVMLYSSIGKSTVTGQPAPYNEGRTATHEIGHWLGLRHIWGDSPNCAVDDYCLDTPPSDAANYGCATTHQSCGSLDMVQNYMDYSDDICMNIFTKDQRMRMRTVLENSPIRASLITSDACVPPAVSDASVVNIISPKGDHCPGSITPTVVLRNRGSSNLTSATIQYTIDGGAPVSFSWTGSIAPGGDANVNLPAFTTTLGIHTFRAVSVLPNGVTDPHTEFDASEITFAVSNGYQPNYSQDFDGGQFPPDVRWTVINPNADCFAWVGATAVSSSGVTNNACAVMTNYENGTNQDEYLYTPFFILPCNAASAQLSFDVAYQRRVAGSNDRLRVEISTDCGATWQSTPVYDKSGTTLQTVTTTSNSYWIPTAAGQWRNEVINLGTFVGSSSSSVQFRFRATNAGNGGNLYIDNINFTAVQPEEINVSVNGNDVLDGGAYDFGPQPIGTPVVHTFTVSNSGTSDLTLIPPITITGATNFTVGTSFGVTTVPAGGSTTFTVSFTATGAGPFTASLSFQNSDCDEGTYDFQLTGSGLVTPPAADFSADHTTICQNGNITFTDLSTAASGWSWTFTGGTPATASTAGPHTVNYPVPGTYPVELTVTNPYGTDMETKTGYITVLPGTGQVLPLTEGFTGTTFPPAGWTIDNGGNTNTWQRSGTAGTAPTAGNSAFINFFSSPDTSGDADDLNVPGVDLNGYLSASLTFDVAYARYNATYFDQLDVLVSTDCGQSYTVVYSKSGATLATDPNQTTAYTNPATWRNENIDLTPYIGNGKVDVKFRGISGYGQYLYIDNININGVPDVIEADFTLSEPEICNGETVTFTDNSSGAVSWSWDFGAGASPATSTGQGPHTVTYSTLGTKTVTLSINGGADAATQTVVVNTAAAPVVSAADNCGSSTLTATGSNLLWSTGETTASITVTSSGTYTVTQTVGGCESEPASVIANPVAVPSVPVVSVSDDCGSSVLAATGSNLLWSTGETTASITVTSSGTYTVTQTVGGCESAAASVTAAPFAVPSAPVVSVSDGCSSSVLTATGSNLLWSTGETTASVTVTASGTYTVTQTVGTCESTPASVTVTVGSAPPAPVVSVSDNCGSSILTATGSNLLWSTGETTASITVTSSGTYTVTQTVGGCESDEASVVADPVAVPSAPVVSVSDDCGSSVLTATGSNLLWSTGETTASIIVTSSGTYTVTQTVGSCESAAASATANPGVIPPAPLVSVTDSCGISRLSATGTNLLWSTGETSPSIVVTTAGTFSVSQVVNGCISPVAVVTSSPWEHPVIILDTIPVVCSYHDAFPLTAGTPVGGTYTGNGVSGGVFDPSAAGLGETVITYEYTDLNGCSASAQTTVTVDACLGIGAKEIWFEVYPNPNSGIFAVHSSEKLLNIQVFDHAGRLVYDLPDPGVNQQEIDLSAFTDGVYQVVTATESTVRVSKIAIRK